MTRFPEYVSARLPIPQSWTYAVLRRFQTGSVRTYAMSLFVGAVAIVGYYLWR